MHIIILKPTNVEHTAFESEPIQVTSNFSGNIGLEENA